VDIELSQEQSEIRAAARRFLERECPFALVRELETDEAGFSLELWRKSADLGWLGLNLPEAYGGTAMGAIDLVVLAKEMGRALYTSPYLPTVVQVGGAIAAVGSEEQKQQYLPRIVAGDAVLGFAIQEASRHYDHRAVATTAASTGGGFALNGEKRFVAFANSAERILVVARTSGERADRDGLTMFLVDPASPGVELRALGTLARDRQHHVLLRDVRVGAEDVVGPVGGAWPTLARVIEQGVVTFCASMVGAAEKIHEMARDFAVERVQFGRPIASFQVVAHYLAQMAIDIVSTDTSVSYSAWILDEGAPSRLVVALAKICAGDLFQTASSRGAEIFGGMGFAEEMDATLFLRRGKQWQLSMGDNRFWEEVVCEELFDEVSV
jgi:alkylation response protein AidB-like acyl-CoA dehydrogenase